MTDGVQRNFQHTYIPYNTIKLRQNETDFAGMNKLTDKVQLYNVCQVCELCWI